MFTVLNHRMEHSTTAGTLSSPPPLSPPAPLSPPSPQSPTTPLHHRAVTITAEVHSEPHRSSTVDEDTTDFVNFQGETFANELRAFAKRDNIRRSKSLLVALKTEPEEPFTNEGYPTVMTHNERYPKMFGVSWGHDTGTGEDLSGDASEESVKGEEGEVCSGERRDVVLEIEGVCVGESGDVLDTVSVSDGYEDTTKEPSAAGHGMYVDLSHSR